MTTIDKGALLVVANALKRAFASAVALDVIEAVPPAAGLVVALFQSRDYFEVESERYVSFALAGATVVVGFPGAVNLPPGLIGVDITGREELIDAWVLLLFCGPLTGALVAVDQHELLEGAGSFEASRAFTLRFTVRREAIDSARQVLRPLRGRLSTRSLALCEAALRRSEDEAVSAGEDFLATAFETLVAGIGRADRRKSEQRAADLDLLTGLYNRRFLAHYLNGAEASGVQVVAVLADVDDLGQINERHGSDVGDRVLVQVASALSAEVDPGDLIVRYGDDEFLVLAAANRKDGPLALAERLCSAVSAMRFPKPLDDLEVSISAGAMLTDVASLAGDHLIDAVRLSKLLGKNMARLAD